MEAVSQKEYLKKYLSGKKDGKKKKRKKKDIATDRVNIIDDDIDLSQISSGVNDDLFGANEDAPQIVGIIDDRPMHMRIDDYRKSDLWKPLGSGTEPQGSSNSTDNMVTKTEKEILLTFLKKGSNHLLINNKKIKTKHESRNTTPPDRGPSKSEKVCDDNSPPRKRSAQSESDSRKSPYRSSSSKDVDKSSPRRSRSRSRNTPQVSRWNIGSNSSKKTISPLRKGGGDDISPLRKMRRDSDNSPSRKGSDQDISPPRRVRRDSDNSPQRKGKDKNSSPPRRASRFSDSTPPRRQTKDTSPPRRKLLPGDKKGKYLIPAKRMGKTLDGKTAGLQNAQELVKENEAFRKREEELYKNMSSEVSGANALTVLRDRKTGKIRDLQKEAQDRLVKEKQEEANKEKYMRWGKGLKQVEDYENKLQDDLLEMNKPLARYADDEDLERYLREQDREGDPMLDYIRKKRRKKDVETGKPIKQQFEGEFMPNRFGIRPGHRWDGVDRSNGYEKKWIDVQNAKYAQQEEVYKWSTEDM